MSGFIVSVTQNEQRIIYTAIARSSVDCILAAIDLFGVASVTAKPREVQHAK